MGSPAAAVSSAQASVPRLASVVSQSLTLSAPATAETRLAFTLAGYGSPARAGRVVAIQRISGKSWIEVTRTTEASTGRYAVATSISSAGRFTYRAVALAWPGLPAAASVARVVSVHVPYILLTPPTAIAAETVRVTGLLPGVASRPVWVQRLSGKTWLTLVKTTSSRTASYSTAFRAPAAGSYAVRSLAPRVVIAGKVRAQYVCPAKTLRVVAQAASLSVPATLVEGRTGSATLTFAPARLGRVVYLQVLRAGVWTWVATGKQSGAGAATLTLTAGTPGAYSYRGYTAASAGAAAFASLPRTLNVIPAPVTGVTATASSRSIALSWTNPTSASVTGVMIRRALGATAPTSATAGVLVIDAAKPAVSFVDPGLVPGTQYSYALFAHAGATLFATAATVTSTTIAPPGPVTGVIASPASTSIALSWTNPPSGSPSGVMIRRLAGATPPASPGEGDLVAEAPYPATFVNDTGLATQTQYSYALFAYNDTSNYAVPATVTATTTPDGTGAVSGLVTDAGGTHHGLEGVEVTVSSVSTGAHTSVFTHADGGYAVAALPPGSDYTVCFSGSRATGGASDETGYVDQCWQDQPTSGTATPVAVTSVATSTGINGALVAGGAISGTVTEAGGTGHGLANVVVQVSSPSTGLRPSVSTAPDGSYTVPGLPADTAYRVCFQAAGATGGSSDPTGYIDQCWRNQPTSDTATSVTVTQSSATEIDAALAGQGGVTNVTATPTTTSVVLTWTNPSGAALAGVMIRRALGATPPASATAGEEVHDVLKPTTTYTDAGLISGKQYSYALFAHDGTPLYSASATITTTTLITAAMISTGSWHSCAVTTAAGVKCWGYNAGGRLGDGTTINRSTPVDVAGLTEAVTAVSAGGSHTCALTSTGGVKCWGFNGSGELGDGSTTPSNVPVDVVGLGPGSGVLAVSAGDSHSCAVTSTGGVMCWGFNGNGELGDGSTTSPRTAPVDVVGLGPGSGALAVSAGASHSCALTATGTVKCWGSNGNGELGDGSTTLRTAPVDVVGLGTGVRAVSAGGGYTCAVTSAGGARCWGSNGNGQLGNGSTGMSSSPVGVTGLATGVSAVLAGWSGHSCAVTTGGAVMCWGYNDSGQLGDQTTTERTAPVGVVGLGSGAAAVSAGGYHSCALTSTGAARCWGKNDSGQLGDGTTTDSTIPVDVFGLKPG